MGIAPITDVLRAFCDGSAELLRERDECSDLQPISECRDAIRRQVR